MQNISIKFPVPQGWLELGDKQYVTFIRFSPPTVRANEGRGQSSSQSEAQAMSLNLCRVQPNLGVSNSRLTRLIR